MYSTMTLACVYPAEDKSWWHDINIVTFYLRSKWWLLCFLKIWTEIMLNCTLTPLKENPRSCRETPRPIVWCKIISLKYRLTLYILRPEVSWNSAAHITAIIVKYTLHVECYAWCCIISGHKARKGCGSWGDVVTRHSYLGIFVFIDTSNLANLSWLWASHSLYPGPFIIDHCIIVLHIKNM